jgi:hypothetical protein
VPNAEEYPGFAPTGTDTKTTSAQPGDEPTPPGGGLDVGNIGQVIAQGLALGGLGAGGGVLAGQAMNRPNYQLGLNEPGVLATTGPGTQPVGDQYRLSTSEQPTPAPMSDMDIAMARAMEPAGGPPRLGGPPNISGVKPVVDPSQIIAQQQRLPPGVSNVGGVNAGQALPTVAQPPPPPPGEGNIPIAPKVGPQPLSRSLPEVKSGRLLEGLLRR